MKNTHTNTVLFNPSSGGGRALKNLERVKAAFTNSSLSFEWIVTKSEEHLRMLVHEKNKSASLVAIGGDSTITIVADEIVKGGHSIPLGLVPLGSSDDIALDYKIPSIEKAVQAIKEQRKVPTDVGRIRSQNRVVTHFLGQANIGIGVSVNRRVAQMAKARKPVSKIQFAAGLLGMLQSYKYKEVPFQAHLIHPEENITGDFISILFSKIKYWASGRLYAPRALTDDGNLHCVLIRSCSFFRLLRLTQLSANGKHLGQKEVVALSSTKFKISSPNAFAIQVDGDILRSKEGEILFKQAELDVLASRLFVFR